ncbi:MAG TPA: ChbG/HpnK family deacetylase [Acidisarcina sp.]|nr:ChbG/HpnK family deacetylase [Acidisarcina sp.]
MKRLIVNADDFGLTPGVNRAILDLNERGVLPSTTLMATAECFEPAALAAVAQSSLGTGCHVTLVDGRSWLAGDQLPRLTVGATGLFRRTLGSFVQDLLRNRIPEAEIEAEATAQIRRLQSAGVRVTHVDTHKHTHMFPGVYRPLLRAAITCGVPAIRNPFEPEWSVRLTSNAGLVRRLQVRGLRWMRRGFLDAVRQARIATTEGAIGVLATGTLNASILRAFVAAMPEGVWELCCHPGYQDAELAAVRTRLRESREIEREALLEVLPHAAGISLIHFGNLAGGSATNGDVTSGNLAAAPAKSH